MAQRLKGLETTLSYVDPDGNDEAVGDMLSFEVTLDIEKLQEGYLGEVADRYDEIFHGVNGTCELHIETSRIFDFAQKIIDRAQRRTPAAGKFVAVSTLALPNGSRVRLTFPDVFFGQIPIRSPSRSEYVTITVEWSCSSMRRT